MLVGGCPPAPQQQSVLVRTCLTMTVIGVVGDVQSLAAVFCSWVVSVIWTKPHTFVARAVQAMGVLMS